MCLSIMFDIDNNFDYGYDLFSDARQVCNYIHFCLYTYITYPGNTV